MGNTWKVAVWGARGSMPVASSEFFGYGGNTACISVDRGEGGIVVFDAGSGLARLGESLAEGPEESLADGKKEPEGSKGRGAGPMDRGREKRVHILLTISTWTISSGFSAFGCSMTPTPRSTSTDRGAEGACRGSWSIFSVCPTGPWAWRI